MSVRSAQSITVLFTTRVWATGVGANADSLPTGTLYVNGTADGATVTVTNITTGLYKAALTLPTLAIGDIVDLRINATVSSVADNAVIWRDSKDVLLDGSGDVTFNNTSIATVTTVTNQLTAAAITTNIWQDLLAGADFGTAGSIGALLKLDIDAAISSRMATFSLPTNFAALLISAGGHISNVDVLTTYTGNTPQTGDAFARIGAAGAGLTAVVLAAAGLNAVLVDSKTLPAAMQIIAASAIGKISGAGTGTEVFLGLDGATTRATVTVDASGNRTNVVYA